MDRVRTPKEIIADALSRRVPQDQLAAELAEEIAVMELSNVLLRRRVAQLESVVSRYDFIRKSPGALARIEPAQDQRR